MFLKNDLTAFFFMGLEIEGFIAILGVVLVQKFAKSKFEDKQ